MMTMKEVQATELEILKKIHDFCVKHNLRYVLAYGTLLGAVRHHGFIPWDNDVDIAMPREDFGRFLLLTKDEPVGDHLYVEHYTTDPKYHYMCIRVCDDRTRVNIPYIREQPSSMGIWVDIFPLDPLCTDFGRCSLQKVLFKFYWLLFRTDVYGEDKYRNFAVKLAKKSAALFFPNKNNRNNYRIDAISQWGSASRTREVAFVFAMYEEGICSISIDDINAPILLDFEAYQFFCPRNYDLFLIRCYGDYMTLPPLEKRLTHEIEAYSTNSVQ